jgi:hypothetical protein
VAGWVVADHLRTEPVADALQTICRRRRATGSAILTVLALTAAEAADKRIEKTTVRPTPAAPAAAPEQAVGPEGSTDGLVQGRDGGSGGRRAD